MTWVRLDDGIGENPKVAAVSDHAFALYVTSIAYANRNLTDGFIPRSVGLGQLRFCEGRAADTATELERAGLWEATAGGWTIHDYHEYQPSKEDVLAAQEAKREAGRRGGQAAAKARAQAPATAEPQAPAVAGGQAKSKPIPNPNPTPNPKPSSHSQTVGQDLSSASADARDTFDEFWARYPRQRNGSKPERKKAWDRWRKLSDLQQQRALVAVEHYAKACESGTWAKHAFRWLADETFEDWQTPAKPRLVAASRARGEEGLVEFADRHGVFDAG